MSSVTAPQMAITFLRDPQTGDRYLRDVDLLKWLRKTARHPDNQHPYVQALIKAQIGWLEGA